jgi:hypothetical protein
MQRSLECSREGLQDTIATSMHQGNQLTRTQIYQHLPLPRAHLRSLRSTSRPATRNDLVHLLTRSRSFLSCRRNLSMPATPFNGGHGGRHSFPNSLALHEILQVPPSQWSAFSLGDEIPYLCAAQAWSQIPFVL